MTILRGDKRGWGFIAPALLWTLAFFVVPFLVMGAMSFATLEGRTLVWGLSLDNYAEPGKSGSCGGRSSCRLRSR